MADDEADLLAQLEQTLRGARSRLADLVALASTAPAGEAVEPSGPAGVPAVEPLPPPDVLCARPSPPPALQLPTEVAAPPVVLAEDPAPVEQPTG